VPATGLRDCRLLFVNRFFHPDHSASSQLLSDLAFALAARAGGVEVVTSRLSYEAGASDLPARESHRGVDIHRVAGTSFGRGSALGRAADYASFLASARGAVSRLARPDSVVIAKTDPPMLGSLTVGPTHARGACFVNWIQDLFPEIAERAGVALMGGPVAGALKRLRRRALAGAAATVVIGEGMAQAVRATGAAAEGSVHVIPNWADGAAIRPMPRESGALRDAWGLTDKFVVGYSGNMGRVHALDTVIDAAARLADDAGVRFLFVGGGSQLPSLREAVARRRLGNVVFAPYQPRESLARSLAVPDVHLCTLDPRFEGLAVPGKVYGIMAAGRPCIAVGAKEGEIAQLLARGGFGSAVEAGDGEALARAIGHMRSLGADLGELGARARRLFEAEFDLPIAVQRWAEVLEEARARHRRGGARPI